MLEAILSLIPGGGLTALAGVVVAAFAAIVSVFTAGKRAGRNAEKAKEKDAYEDHIREVERASDARPSGSVSDDKHNRDNW